MTVNKTTKPKVGKWHIFNHYENYLFLVCAQVTWHGQRQSASSNGRIREYPGTCNDWSSRYAAPTSCVSTMHEQPSGEIVQRNHVTYVSMPIQTKSKAKVGDTASPQSKPMYAEQTPSAGGPCSSKASTRYLLSQWNQGQP